MDRIRDRRGRSARPQGRALPDHRLVGRQTLLDRVGHQLEGSRRVMLRGDAGVGKSRVLDALAERAERPVVHWSAGHPGDRTEPWATLHQPTDAAGVLVLVDDLDALEPSAQDQLGRLAVEPWCMLAATTRHEAVAGSTAPWTWMQVPPLSRLATSELLTEALHGVVDPDVVTAIHTASGGIPGAIVELAGAAHELGCLVEGRDAWELVGALPVAPPATSPRIAGLDPAARTTLERIALGGPLPIRVANRALDPIAVRELDRRGLVRLYGRGGNAAIDLVEAVVGESVRRELSPDRRRAHVRVLAEAFEPCADPAIGGDRVARWRLEIGGWDAAAFEAAAVRAYRGGDHVLANELVERAMASDGGIRAQVLAAVTAAERGRDVSARALAEAASAAADGVPRAAAWATMAQATAEAIGAGRWQRATDDLERRAAVLDPIDRVEARAYGAALAAWSGATEVARTAIDELAGADSGRCALAVADALVAADRLRPVDLDEATLALSDERATRTRSIPLADELVHGAAWLVATDRTPQEAIIATRAELDRGLHQGGPIAAWWSFVHGQLHLRAGELRAARVRFVEAGLLLHEVDPLRLRPRVVVGQALVAATTGMIAHAGALLEGMADEPVAPRVATTRGLVEALVLAGERGASAGAVHALAVGDEALADGRRTDALEAWHLAVRLDLTSGVAERIDALVEELATEPTPGPHPWIELVADHARALGADDADGLRAVAARAAALGWRLVAAEAAAQAARCAPTAARLALASGLAAGCPEADTPAIQRIERVVLTPRRREAALFAMRGCSGAAIAERLGVSARTVENHLAAVYRGLGVTGRRELVAFYTVDRGPFTDATAVA